MGQKLMQFGYLVKGIIYAAILMAGTVLGSILKSTGVQGFVIWAIVAVANIAATIVVFRFIKFDLDKKTDVTPKDKATA